MLTGLRASPFIGVKDSRVKFEHLGYFVIVQKRVLHTFPLFHSTRANDASITVCGDKRVTIR